MKEIIEEHLRDVDYSHQTIENTLFEDCVFNACLFNGTKINKTVFRNCTFKNSRLMNLEFDSLKLSGARFVECSLIGINFDTFGLDELSLDLKGSRLESCVFEEIDITGMEAEDSVIRECSFLGCEMERVSFAGSDLSATIFEQNNLKDSNFRGATHYELNPQTNQVKKARFSSPEVLVLLKHLDISID